MVAKRNKSHAIGLSGEFLVAAEMAKRGWEVVHTSHGHPGYDLLAHKDGRVVGIRVKAASDTTIKWTAKNDGLLAHYKPGNADDFTAMVLFDKGGVQGARIYVVPTDIVVQAVEPDDRLARVLVQAVGGDLLRFPGHARLLSSGSSVVLRRNPRFQAALPYFRQVR